MKLDRKYWHYALLLPFSLGLVLFYVLVLSKTPFFLNNQYKVNDTLFSHQSTPPAHFLKKTVPAKITALPKQIVVIGVDNESMRRLDRSWPWGREIFAVFLERIRPLNPKVIGFCFSFVGKSQSEEADRWFADELAKSGNIVLASYFDRNSIAPRYAYIPPSELFLKAAKATGFIHVPYDQDGAVRRSRMLLELADNRGFAYSMPVQLACAYKDRRPERSVKILGNDVVFRLPSKKNPSSFKEMIVPLDRSYHIPISFHHPGQYIHYIPFWKIIAGQIDSKEIEGKIVLVGMTSDILHDIHATPIGPMSSVSITAQQTLMILEQDFVKKLWPSHHWIFLLFLAAVFTVIFYRLHYLYGLLALLVAEFAIYEFALWLFVSQRLIFNIFSTLWVLLLVYLVVLFYRGLLTLIENATLQHQVVTDALTGLYNHAYVPRRLKAEFEHCRQTAKEFCFVMIDIDFFKRINDTYGHEQGNKVLVRIADCLKSGVRGCDMVARYGGEEFSMVLCNCNAEAAGQIIEKICRAVEASVFEDPKGNFHVTISAGICSNQERGVKRAEDLIRFADEALYLAKAAGRNRVFIYAPPLRKFIYAAQE